MQTANEIQSAVKNIRYYSQRIKELAKKQFDTDFEQGQKIGVNAKSATMRFDCLGTIQAGCGRLEVYCSNIEANLKAAAEQDKLLYGEEK